MATSKVQNRRNNLLSATITGTTSSSGNLDLNIAHEKCVVALACSNNSFAMAIPWNNGNTGTWWAKVYNPDGTAKSNTSVTITIFYED